MNHLHSFQNWSRKLLFNGITLALLLSSLGPSAAWARAGSRAQPGSGISGVQGETSTAATTAASGTTTRVSIADTGTQANTHVSAAGISGDGKSVLFYSAASNLVSGDTNGKSDVFVVNRVGSVIERVSVGGNAVQANGDSYPGSFGGSISSDGRFVVFVSVANNLTSGDTNGFMDVFVRDRQTHNTVRVSEACDGTQANGQSSYASISADGRFVAFASAASNLVPGDINGYIDVFVRDTQNCQIKRIWQSDGESSAPSISGDGALVAFGSNAPSLADVGDNLPHNEGHVYLYDFNTGITSWVSKPKYYDPNGPGSCCKGASNPMISANGNFVAFNDDDKWLIANDTNNTTDVFVWDRLAASVERVSMGIGESNSWSDLNSISADGRYVGFSSPMFTPGDYLDFTDVFLRDRQQGITERVSLANDGTQGNDESSGGYVSDDGRYVAFSSVAGDLVSGDTNGYMDVFVRDRLGMIPAWTVMLYLDGDNNLDNETWIAMNELETVANNPDVNIIAIWDQYYFPGTSYYEIQPDLDPNNLANYIEGQTSWTKGELNMGDEHTLQDFVQWAKLSYPAQHYALILDDHGSGLGGGMCDETNNDDCMTLNEMGSALLEITEIGTSPLDIVYMYACLMGMLEDGYQFRSYVNYYVASEAIVHGYTEPYSQNIALITATTSPSELATIFANAYASIGALNNDAYTISVADLSKVDDLVDATNNLALLLNTNMATYSLMLQNYVLWRVQYYDANGDDVIGPGDDYLDLCDFAQKIMAYVDPTDPNSMDGQVYQAAQAVCDAVHNYIIQSMAGDSTRRGSLSVINSHGVSIFYPFTASSFYNASNYAFAVGANWQGGTPMPGVPGAAADTVEWGPMLVNYFQTTQPGGPDNPNMPLPVPKLLPDFHAFLPVVVR